jgi:hypothetical protein
MIWHQFQATQEKILQLLMMHFFKSYLNNQNLVESCSKMENNVIKW